MTNQNNVPTAPGWYYRDEYTPARQIVYVQNSATGLVFTLGTGLIMSVKNDGRWRGPVPMPGEWVPIDIFDALLDVAPSTGFPHPAISLAMQWKEHNLSRPTITEHGDPGITYLGGGASWGIETNDEAPQ